jgi:TRAP-type mannitol/chloroaromatic compound transport system permease small subunit
MIASGAGLSGETSVSALLALSRGIDYVNTKLGRVAGWLVLFACLICAGNAMVRYGLSTSSNAWLEIQWYMFAAIVLFGASYTFKVNEHVRVDLVYALVGDRGRLWIDLVGTIFFMLPGIIMLVVMTWPLFANSVVKAPEGQTMPTLSATLDGLLRPDGWERSDQAGGLIRWPVKIMLPIGFFLLTLQGISEMIKRIAALQGAYRVDTKYEKPLQ